MKRRVVAFLCFVALARPAAAQTTIVTIEFWRAAIHFDFDNVDRESARPGPARHTVWILVKIGGRWYASRITQPPPARVPGAVALASVDLPSVLEEIKTLDRRADK